VTNQNMGSIVTPNFLVYFGPEIRHRKDFNCQQLISILNKILFQIECDHQHSIFILSFRYELKYAVQISGRFYAGQIKYRASCKHFFYYLCDKTTSVLLLLR